MTLLLFGLEKIFKVYHLFTLESHPYPPPGAHLPHMNKFRSLPPKDDPYQVW